MAPQTHRHEEERQSWSKQRRRQFRSFTSHDRDGSLVLFGTGFAAGVLLVLLCSIAMSSSRKGTSMLLQHQEAFTWAESPTALLQFPITAVQRAVFGQPPPPTPEDDTEITTPSTTTIRNVALVELGCFLLFRGVPRLVTRLALHSRKIMVLSRGRLWQGAVKLYSRTSLSKIVNRGKKVVKVWWYRTKSRRRRREKKDAATEP